MRELYVATRNIPHRKRRLELWVPIYRLLHRKVAQLVRKKNAASAVERARRQVRDEQLIVVINISFGDAILPDCPVVRVVFP